MNLIIIKPLIRNAIIFLFLIAAVIASKTEGTVNSVFSVLAGILFGSTLYFLICDILGKNNQKKSRWVLLAAFLVLTLVAYLLWNN